MRKKCYECSGTGLIGSYNNVMCYSCRGKGYIEFKKQKEFKATLSNLNYYDEGVTVEDQKKEVFYLGELIKKYLKVTKDAYRGEIIKVKIKCKKGCIQIERIGQ